MSQKEHITLRLNPQDHCKNCDGIVYSKYCSDCGQRHHEGRLSFNILFEEMMAKFFMLDSGILRTLGGVFRPGIVVREYIAGKRKKYVKPINFYLLLLAVYLYVNSFITPFTEVDLLVGKRGFGHSFSRSIGWFSQQLKLIQILTIPLYAFYTLNAFKKWGYNYFEHISLWLYLGAYGSLATIIAVLLLFLVDSLTPITISTNAFSYSMIFALLYGFYSLIDTFKLYSFKGLIKAAWTLMYCFFLVILLITLGVSFIFTLIDLFLINPVL